MSLALSILGVLMLILFFAVVLYVGIKAAPEDEEEDSSGANTAPTVGKLLPTRLRESTTRAPETIKEFKMRVLLAKRRVPLALGVTSMTATWVGAGYMNGTAEAVFDWGLVWCQAPLGYAISLVLGGWLFADKTRQTRGVTMLDPFQQYYGSWIAVLLCIPAICGEVFWTASNLSALGDTAATMTQLNSTLIIVVCIGIIVFYTSLGGLVSVIYTDIIQVSTTILGMWSCLPFLTTTTAVGTIGPPHNYWLGKIEDTDLSQMIDLFLMTIFGGIPWQVYFQRVLSADSIFTAKMLSYMSALGCIFFAIPPVIVGAVAKSANFTAAGYEGPFNLEKDHRKHVLPLALHYLMPGALSVVAQLAITAAVMSSVDSSMLSASSLVAHNVYSIIFRPTATDVEVTTVLRITLCVISLSATVMALNVESVFYLWTLSSDLVYVLLFPQFVALFFLRSQSNTYGAVVGFVVGVTTRAACGEPEMGVPMLVQLPLYDAERGQQFPFRTLCMLLSLGSLLAVSKLAECAFYTGVLPDILHCFRVDPEAALESPASPAKTARTKSASISAAGQSLGHPLEQKGGNTTESAESMSPSTTKKQRKKSTSALPAAVQAARRDTLPNATSLPPHAGKSGKLGVINVDTQGENFSFCYKHYPSFKPLPEGTTEAEAIQLVDMTAQDACLPLHRINLSGKVVLLRDKGGCSLEEVAENFHRAKVYAIVIGISSNKLKLMTPKEPVSGKLFAKDQEVDIGLILMWFIATFTVAAGSFWAGVSSLEMYRYNVHRTSQPSDSSDKAVDAQPASADGGAGDGGAGDGAPQQPLDLQFEKHANARITPTVIVGFVFLMSGVLVVIYMFLDYMVYFIIGMFALASTVALVAVLEPVIYMIPICTTRLPNYAFPCFYGSLEVRQIFLLVSSVVVALSFVAFRHHSWAWILQDLLGMTFSVFLMKTLRLPNLMVIAVLLFLLFIYDIFFVFVTPYILTKEPSPGHTGSYAKSSEKGDSIIVEVARGAKTQENIPMVVRVPHFNNQDINACFGDYSVLGFGDILIPGFLVSYVHGFGLVASQTRLYYLVTVGAYGVGLVVTFVALYTMKMAQPALLYLVPITLIPVIGLAWYRGEMKDIWYGYKQETPSHSEQEEPEPSADAVKRKSSKDEEPGTRAVAAASQQPLYTWPVMRPMYPFPYSRPSRMRHAS
ncbi:uncharacterized protein LOC144179857 [Haemaphysalis longicornis]